jgi:hypothetical protein
LDETEKLPELRLSPVQRLGEQEKFAPEPGQGIVRAEWKPRDRLAGAQALHPSGVSVDGFEVRTGWLDVLIGNCRHASPGAGRATNLVAAGAAFEKLRVAAGGAKRASRD